jgi:flagella basal body P-ring formation protein FlgA
MLTTTAKQVIRYVAMIVLGGLSAECAEIQFKPQAEIRGTLVLLGDVARIEDQDERQVDALRRIELFPSPARGRTRTVSDVEVRQLLQLHGVSPAEHTFSGAGSIRIAHVAPRTPTAEPLRRAAGVSPPVSEETSKIVVASRPIATGDLLRAVDVELQPSRTSTPLDAVAREVDAVVGQESLRSYSPGQPIDPRSLRKPILVRRGDQVVVVAKAAGVRVQTTAKALADGTLGDLLPVESPTNREKYSAVVTGPRQAEVFASGSKVEDVRQGQNDVGGARR